MKLYLSIILLSAFVTLSFAQKTPSPVPQKPKIFGSSLEKYKDKKKRDVQGNKKSDEPDDDEVIRVKTDLVVDYVLVTNQNGKMITNLKKDDFIVTEDSAPQTIEMFSSDENASFPRSIILIIDDSLWQAPHVRNSIEAAKLLVDKLNPNDKMAIVTDDVKLQIDFTTDKTLLKKTLDSLGKKTVKPWGGAEFDALLAVLNEMFDEKDSRRIIIFQGNGNEIVRVKTGDDTLWRFYTSFLISGGERAYLKRYLEFSDIQEAIESSRATIYSIIPGIRVLGLSKKEQFARAGISLKNIRDYWIFKTGPRLENLQRQFQETEVKRLVAAQTAMFNVAELSGGDTGFIEKPEDAESIYSNIFKQISNRYVIGYYPTNQEQDGKLRKINIEVKGHPEYIIKGRKSYFPQK